MVELVGTSSGSSDCESFIIGICVRDGSVERLISAVEFRFIIPQVSGDVCARSCNPCAKSNYGARKSEYTPILHVPVTEPRVDLPRTHALLSAILPDKVEDFLQVHISLPQINTVPNMDTATLRPTTVSAIAIATNA